MTNQKQQEKAVLYAVIDIKRDELIRRKLYKKSFLREALSKLKTKPVKQGSIS